MLELLLWHIIAGYLSIFLATKFINEVSLELLPGGSVFFGITLSEQWQLLLITGTILGVINFFIKPIVKKITLPLRILTLGLFSLILNMAMIWFLDVLLQEFQILNITALFWTTMIVWTTNFFLGLKN
jgi:putative membrane protein